ncbi:MAG: glutamate--tRNA ligase [Candidatus Paracaedibacteraceae bacterium]|nr:glutamate--tRNA ligase [Candidatus Paracaedibacteraceae bacterium]
MAQQTSSLTCTESSDLNTSSFQPSTTPIVRFAPSPTGFLHIGGARTALFNWLYAKHHGGRFLLRIEDTDKARSSEDAVEAIFNSLNWLGITSDFDVVFQSTRAARHAEIAHKMVANGKAYYCYCSPEEVEKMREDARANGMQPRYNGFWRDRDPLLKPANISPVVRLKAPTDGETIIEDLVQGTVRVQNKQLDDFILLRADGSPTYMLSVVVDDHDMHISHIIRGDDHLTNAFRQKQIYEACGWTVPHFAHIPLIHGPDGAKLSKRHGAMSAEEYRSMGFLPETICNYLLKLGWGHGDDEIISIEQAVEWFDVDGIGRAPARLDMLKLTNLNGHYIRIADNQRLLDLITPFLTEALRRTPEPLERNHILRGMNGLKERAKTVIELADGALVYTTKELEYDEKALTFCNETAKAHVAAVREALVSTDFTHDTLEVMLRNCAQTLNLKLGALAQPLRVALTHRSVSPSLFELMEILGREETMKRLNSYLT